MFFCDACAKKQNWPTSLFGSYGPCEVCGNMDECNDVPSKYLPMPKPVTDLTPLEDNK